MNKPAIITTKKPLPFAELSPDEFERMCLWLVDREGYERPQHLGEAGGEQGRDIVAYKITGTGEETWYFQCKRRNRITSTAFEKEIDKYNQLASETPDKQPTGIIFVTNAAVSARIRDKIAAYCRLFGYQCDFWARTELDLRVKKHEDIVREFFYVFGVSGFATNLTNCGPAVSRMVEDYSVVFSGRDKEIGELNRFLNHTDLPCALIVAPTGRGKTALLIHWIENIRRTGEWSIVFHPISQRYQTATSQVALSALTSGLADFYGATIGNYSTSPDQLRFLVNDLLHGEIPNGQRLLVVLDGLDETIGWHVDRSLFPREMPKNVKIVFSVREIALRKPEGWLDQLGWRPSQSFVMGLGLLDRSAVSDLLTKCGPFEGAISNDEVASQLLRVSQGDPLTIRYLIDALREGELTPQKLSAVPPGLEAFIDYWIRELEPRISKDIVAYSFLGLLGAAVAPLANEDLKNLAPEMFSRSVVARDVVRSVERFVTGDGSSENGYVLSHPRLREIFFEQLSASEQTSFREQFVDYGLSSWRQRFGKLPPYVRLHWIKQLAEASEWNQMREVLTSFELLDGKVRQPWCHIRFKNEGSYAGYLSDLSILWGEAETSSNLALITRCALIFSSIRSMSGNFAPELIADLVAVGSSEGRWPVSAAIEYIKQIPDYRIQSLALEQLSKNTPDLPVELALSVIEAIGHERFRASALEGIGLLVNQSLIDQVMAIVRSIHEPYAKAIALCATASRLSEEEKSNALNEAMNVAQTISEKRLRISALARIAVQHTKKSSLPIWKQALEDATEIEATTDRSSALAGLGPHLPKQLMPTFLQSIRSLEIARRKADILTEVLDRLPRDMHDEVWKIAIQHLSEPVFIRCEVGVKLAQSSISLSHHLRDRLLAAARSIEKPQGRARALASLAFRMPEESQRVVWNDVIEAARLVKDPEMPAETSQKAGTWLDVLPLMPVDVAADIWMEALEATLGMFNDHHPLNYDLFCDLIKIIPSSWLPLALDLARKGDVKPMLGKRLVNIGRRFGGEKQKALLTEALSTVQEVEDSHMIAAAIGSIGPHLHPNSTVRVIEIVRALEDDLSQFTALQGLAQSLPEEDGIAIWQEALSLIREDDSKWRHDWANWNALSDVICRVPDGLLDRVLEIGLKMRHAEARARTLSEVAKRLSDSKAFVVWQEVLNASASSLSSLGLALSYLQPKLSPEKQVRQWKYFLEISIGIKDDYSRKLAVTGLAPYLPSSLLSAVIDFTEQMGRTPELDRVEILERIVPRLPPELFPRLISIAQDSPCAWATSRLLGALSSRVFDDERDALLDKALRTLEKTNSDFDRYYGLEGLAPNLSNNFFTRAAAMALSITDPGLRAQALVAFGDALPSEALRAALHSASLTTEWSTRVRVLGRVATLLAGKCRMSTSFARDSADLWAETIRLVSLYGRNHLLQAIAAMVPWLASFSTSQDMDKVLDSILDSRCSWA